MEGAFWLIYIFIFFIFSFFVWWCDDYTACGYDDGYDDYDDD